MTAARIVVGDHSGRIWCDRLTARCDSWTGRWPHVLIVYGIGWQPTPIPEEDK